MSTSEWHAEGEMIEGAAATMIREPSIDLEW
jgi:hypothetical protein